MPSATQSARSNERNHDASPDRRRGSEHPDIERRGSKPHPALARREWAGETLASAHRQREHT